MGSIQLEPGHETQAAKQLAEQIGIVGKTEIDDKGRTLLQILSNCRKLLQRRFKVSCYVGGDNLRCWKIRRLFQSVIL